MTILRRLAWAVTGLVIGATFYSLFFGDRQGLTVAGACIAVGSTIYLGILEGRSEW